VGATVSRGSGFPAAIEESFQIMSYTKGSHRLRKGRVSEIGQYYLVTTATLGRSPVFTLPEAAQLVLSSLQWLKNKGLILLECAVVMPDHLHFVAQLRSASLGAVVQSVKGFSSRQINLLLRRKGPLWQSLYYDHAIRTDEVLEDVVLYCLYNPVRAGLVEDFHQYPFWYCRWEP